MKILVERREIEIAWDALCRVSTLAMTSPREACELHEATGILAEILRENPEPECDALYLSPELITKHIRREMENREAILDVLDMLVRHGQQEAPSVSSLLTESRDLQAKWAGVA